MVIVIDGGGMGYCARGESNTCTLAVIRLRRSCSMVDIPIKIENG